MNVSGFSFFSSSSSLHFLPFFSSTKNDNMDHLQQSSITHRSLSDVHTRLDINIVLGNILSILERDITGDFKPGVAAEAYG